MSKSLSILAILCIVFMLLIPHFVEATSVNMNLTSPNGNNSISNTSVDSSINTNTQSTSENLTSQGDYSNPSTTLSSLNTSYDSGLDLGNVLNIILIVIGILLVLLGIAIIIRLKH